MKRGHVKSRSKSIAALIRKLISQREPDPAYLAGYFPSYRQRLHHYELGESSIKLDSFIDLMTALRCEVVVVPLGREMDGGWYVPLRERLCGLAEQVCGADPVLLDAGCGEGYYTAALCATLQRHGGRTAGVDLSKAAARKAAKRCADAEIAGAKGEGKPLRELWISRRAVDAFFGTRGRSQDEVRLAVLGAVGVQDRAEERRSEDEVSYDGRRIGKQVRTIYSSPDGWELVFHGPLAVFDAHSLSAARRAGVFRPAGSLTLRRR